MSHGKTLGTNFESEKHLILARHNGKVYHEFGVRKKALAEVSYDNLKDSDCNLPIMTSQKIPNADWSK